MEENIKLEFGLELRLAFVNKNKNQQKHLASNLG